MAPQAISLGAKATSSVPWVGRAALATGVVDAERLAAALEAQAEGSPRSLGDLLELGAANRARVEAYLAVHRGELLREVEDLAFARWALARGLDEEALAASRRLLETHPGGRLWEAVLATGALELDSTPCLTRMPLECPATCGVLLEVPAPLAPHVERCPACGVRRGEAPSPRAPGSGSAPPADAQDRLTDAALGVWASIRGVTLGAPGPGQRIGDLLVEDTAVRPGELMTALADPVPVACRGCATTWSLGAELASYAPALTCPVCGCSLRAVTLAPRRPATDDGTLASSQRLGPWRLLRRLGRGGMGDVWEARDGDGRRAAVKLHTGALGNEVARQRFEREAEALAAVSHPNIVGLLGSGVCERTGRPYVALELVEGRDLAAILDERPEGRLAPEEVAWVLVQAVSGLARLHAAGILHRDVKPANVLVTERGALKLVDLGMALLTDHRTRLTKAGSIVGTAYFLAPELLDDERAWSAAADLYSLGAAAYRLLTGRPPFDGASAAQVFERRRRGPAPDPSLAAPDAPAALLEVVRRLLDADPARRGTSAEVHAALEPLALAADTSRLRADASRRERPRAPSESALEPGAVVGNCRIERELGRGGMGVVYLAQHLGLRRPVALKVLLAGSSATAEDRRRFLREAGAAATLKHPAIVPVLDAGERDGTWYIVLEYVDGRSLVEALAEADLRARLALFVRVCEGVHHAHSHGVIHRDLKPDNILVDAAGEPHILDFGIAKRLDAGAESAALTTEGDVLGTLRYMPPEQAAGRRDDVDVRSDVYALGSILYELCAGRTPFLGDLRELLHQVVLVEPASPSRWRPDLPWELDAICRRALEKERDDRYQSALELRRDVERFLQGQAIVASRATAVLRARRWVARNRRKAAAIAAGALVVVGGAAIGAGSVAARERARVAAIEAGAAAGWACLARGADADAVVEFEQARRAIGVDEVLRLGPGARAAVAPDVLQALDPEERDRPRITADRLSAWAARAREAVRSGQATRLAAEARAVLAAGRPLDAARGLIAARRLAVESPAVDAIAAQVVGELVGRGRAQLAQAAGRAADAWEVRAADLQGAASCLAAAQELDGAAAVGPLAELERARVALQQDQARAERLREARARAEQGLRCLSDAAALTERGARAEAADRLAEARLALTAALDRWPELEEAREGSARVALALAALWLDAQKAELAEQELRLAKVWGRLEPDIAAMTSRVRAVDTVEHTRREHVDRAEALLAEGRHAEAAATLGLAQSLRADAAVERRRALATALARADEARARQDADEEVAALEAALPLHEDRGALEVPLERARAARASLRLTEAERAHRAAAGGAGSWDEAVRRWRMAVAASSGALEALRGHADALAERDRPADMVVVGVPAGLIGSRGDIHRIYVERTEVTCGRYARFVREGGYARRELWTDEGWAARARYLGADGQPGPLGWSGGPPAGGEDLPVTGVSFHEARAFAAWAGRRLPTEVEWQVAACIGREGAATRFPWGDAPPAAWAPSAGPAPVGSAPFDVGPWGARDLGLNVSEWVGPARPGEPPAVRGLSFRALPHDLTGGTLTWRKTPRPTFRDAAVGFRCVADAPVEDRR